MKNNAPLIHPAYTDAVFKHLMLEDEMRNAFFSRVLGTEILDSKMMDPALSPFDDLHETRTLIEELIRKDNLKKLKSFSNVITEEERPLLQKVLQCLQRVQAQFPDKQRLTTLDVICRTTSHMINI